MGSRIREKPERLFEVFVEIAKPEGGDKGPFIIQKYPEDYDDKEALAMIPKFAYPCETDASKVDHFTFVLTDVESMFRFGYCRHATGHQTCLCILSCLPWYEVFFKLLDLLASITNSPEQGSGVVEFLQATYSQEVPLPAIPVTIVAGENMFNFTCPEQNVLLSIPKSRNLTEYYNAVDPSNMMRIFACMIQERRIYMTSKKLSRLTACIHAAEALLYPMHWQHLYIPILPAHLIDYVSAPMPFLIGIHSNLVEKLKINRVDVADAVIVDLDSNTVTTEYDDLESMPEDVSTYLKKSLKTDVIRNSMTKNGDAVSVAFLQALVRLIGGYREALKIRPEEPITFDPEVFVRSRSSQSTQTFLEGMLSLQIFQQFIYGRLEILNSGVGFTDIFEQQATAYADKLNSQSNYKEWLKSVKKGGRKGKEVLSGLKGKGKKAFADMRTKISSMTENDEKRGSNPAFQVSGGLVHFKDRQRSITEERKAKRPPRPPPPASGDNRTSGVVTEDSHDDSQLRLSYHTVDVSLMADQDIQAAMMRSASAEVLPKNGEDWSGSTSTISSDSRSVDDTDSANIPFGSLQSSDDESQSSLVDLPPVAYRSQSSISSQSTNSSDFVTVDKLIVKAKPKASPSTNASRQQPSQSSKPPVIPVRVPINQGSSSSNSPNQARKAEELRPPPRKPMASRQPIVQPQQPQTNSVTPLPAATSVTIQDAPLIRFESSESEATDSEVFDPLALPKSTSASKTTANPQSITSIDEMAMSDVTVREKEDGVSTDNKSLQRGSSSRSSLTRSQAFRRDSQKVPKRKGSSAEDDDNDEENRDDVKDPTAVIFDPLTSHCTDAKISPGMATPVPQTKPRRDSSADLMKHEWSLASLAHGPRVFLPLGQKSSNNQQSQGIARQSTLPASMTVPYQQPMTTSRGPLAHQGSVQATSRLAGTGHTMPGLGLANRNVNVPYRSQPLTSSIKTPPNPQLGGGVLPKGNSPSSQQTMTPSPSLLSSSKPTSSSPVSPLTQGHLRPTSTNAPHPYTQAKPIFPTTQPVRTQSPFNSTSQNSSKTLFNSNPSSKQNINPNHKPSKAIDPFGDLLNMQFGDNSKKQQQQQQQQQKQGPVNTKPPPGPSQPRWETFE